MGATLHKQGSDFTKIGFQIPDFSSLTGGEKSEF